MVPGREFQIRGAMHAKLRRANVDNLQVGKSRDCAACDIGLYAGPDAQFQLNTLSDGDAIYEIHLPLL